MRVLPGLGAAVAAKTAESCLCLPCRTLSRIKRTSIASSHFRMEVADDTGRLIVNVFGCDRMYADMIVGGTYRFYLSHAKFRAAHSTYNHTGHSFEVALEENSEYVLTHDAALCKIFEEHVRNYEPCAFGSVISKPAGCRVLIEAWVAAVTSVPPTRAELHLRDEESSIMCLVTRLDARTLDMVLASEGKRVSVRCMRLTSETPALTAFSNNIHIVSDSREEDTVSVGLRAGAKRFCSSSRRAMASEERACAREAADVLDCLHDVNVPQLGPVDMDVEDVTDGAHLRPSSAPAGILLTVCGLQAGMAAALSPPPIARQLASGPCVMCGGCDDEGLIIVCDCCGKPMHEDCEHWTKDVEGAYVMCATCDYVSDCLRDDFGIRAGGLRMPSRAAPMKKKRTMDDYVGPFAGNFNARGTTTSIDAPPPPPLFQRCSSAAVLARNATTLARRYPLPGDDAIVFTEEGHTYTVGGVSIERSCTSLVNAEFACFDAEECIASRYERWKAHPQRRPDLAEIINVVLDAGGTDDDAKVAIKTSWEQKGDAASELGTLFHRHCEYVLNDEECPPCQSILIEQQQFAAFMKEVLAGEGYRPYRTELCVAYQDVTAGQIDALFKHPNGAVMMVDFKRVKCTHRLDACDTGYMGATALDPVLSHLDDTHHVRYSLQQSSEPCSAQTIALGVELGVEHSSASGRVC